METVLVTGGAGFIGSHLCERLLSGGSRVICLDNLFTGSRKNIAHLFSNNQFEFIEHDIIDPFRYDSGFLHRIYNLACPASPVHYQENPIRTVKANTIGMINVLGLARLHGARLLQASTSEVYGDPEVHPQLENYHGNVNPIGPRACYDEGKRVAETLIYDYHRTHGMEVRVARIFNTYGPRMAADDGRVISNFITQALAGEPITLYGDGSQTRSFCYVSDMVDGLMRLMNADSVTGPVNLGNPHEVSIAKIAETVCALSGSSSQIEYRPLPEDDPRRRQPDITLAKRVLNWKPIVELEDGLQRTIDSFRERANGAH